MRLSNECIRREAKPRLKKSPSGQPFAERVKTKITISETGCWIWNGSLSHGYGNMGKIRGKGTIRTHRASWEAFHGPIPEGMCVLHKCDVRACCNPDHLFLGTKKENMEDCIRKGRFAYSKNRAGTNNPQAKLTFEQVLEIKTRAKAGVTAAQMNKEGRYPMNRQGIWCVMQTENWAHVQAIVDSSDLASTSG